MALPVTSQVIQGDISETARLIIQNGMILYALTPAGATADQAPPASPGRRAGAAPPGRRGRRARR